MRKSRGEQPGSRHNDTAISAIFAILMNWEVMSHELILKQVDYDLQFSLEAFISSGF